MLCSREGKRLGVLFIMRDIQSRLGSNVNGWPCLSSVEIPGRGQGVAHWCVLHKTKSI